MSRLDSRRENEIFPLSQLLSSISTSKDLNELLTTVGNRDISSGNDDIFRRRIFVYSLVDKHSDQDRSIDLGNTLKKPAVQSSSSLSGKQSGNANETEAFDTSDELLDDLVKNATLTASRDALKQRKTARYGGQRRSRSFKEDSLFLFTFGFLFQFDERCISA